MSDRWSERLSEHLDGQLSPAQAREVKLHLRDCAACTQEVEGLERVRSELRTLPLSAPPERLWHSIRSGLEAGRAAPPRRWRWSLATVSAALTLAAGILLWSAWRGAPHGAGRSAPGLAADAPWRGNGSRVYGAAAAEWREVLLAETSGTELGEMLANDLGHYDRAIAETRLAIEREPGDPLLLAHLARLLKSQVRFLRQADRSAAGAAWEREEKG